MSVGFGMPKMDWSPLQAIGQQLTINAELERQRELERQAAELFGQSLSGYVGSPNTLPAPPAGPVAAFGGGAAPGPAPAPASPLPAFARAQGNAPSSAMAGVFNSASQKYGLDPDFLPRLAMIESGGRPDARNPSGASGVFQFMPKTARAYGLADPFDPAASADAASRLALDNRKILANALGREPTQGELYLGHQQGAGGAAKLLTNPQARAADLVGRQAVIQNGGTPDMTAAEFAAKWVSKFPEGRTAVAQAQGGVTANDAAPIGAVPQQAPGLQPGSLISPPLVDRGPGAQSVGAPAAQRQQITQEEAARLKAMYANPNTRAMALKRIQELQERPKYGFQVLGDQLVRTDEQGRAEVVGIAKNPEFSQFEDKYGNIFAFNKQDGSTRLIREAPQYRDVTSPTERLATQTEGYQGPVQRDPTNRLIAPIRPESETTVNNIVGSGEKAYDVDLGKANAKSFVDIQQAGRDAIKQKNTLTVMDKLLDREGFYSGTGGTLSTAAKRAFASIGIANADQAAPQELFSALANKSILEQAGGSLGSGFSNADREFIERVTANPDTSKEGNRLIIQAGIRAAERAQLVAQMARDYAKRNGGRMDAGFDDEMAQFAKTNPAFGSLGAAPAAPAAPASPAGARAPVRVSTPDEARRLPRGTPILLPDGRQGVVP